MYDSHTLCIIGAGFGALSSVRLLRKQGYTGNITLVAPTTEFHYLPGIIWLPSGLRKREDLVVPLANFFNTMQVTHVQARVTGLSVDGRIVHTDQGDVANDALIIASGGRFIKKLSGIEHVITPCEGITAAETIRDRLKNMQSGTIAIGFAGNPKEPSAVRGGPMFEFLFGIDEQLKREGRRDKFNLIFFNPKTEPGKRLGDKAVKHILATMKKRHIKTHLGYKITGFSNNKVMTEGGDFAADLILFMPGMTGPTWLNNSTLPISDGGMVVADEHCKVAGFEKVYVVGDTGSYPGPAWMPKQAHMADLQAEAATVNILSEINNKTVYKKFVVELICIIDAIDHGTLVFRNHKRTLVLPSSRLFHWAKRFFEKRYLKQYH